MPRIEMADVVTDDALVVMQTVKPPSQPQSKQRLASADCANNCLAGFLLNVTASLEVFLDEAVNKVRFFWLKRALASCAWSVDDSRLHASGFGSPSGKHVY